MGLTSVTLGNFFQTSEGKTVLGGIGGSGLDTESLLKSLTDVRGVSATQSQDQITLNNKQSTALSTFQQLLGSFQTSLDALRNPPGVANDADDVFQFRTGTVSAAGSDYFSITTSPGAALRNYNISDISQLATAATQTTGTFTVASVSASAVSANPISGTSYQFKPGTFTLNGQNITLHEGDSLSTVAAAFNAVSSETGISATLLQLQSGQYKLSFSSTDTGVDSSFDLTDSGNITDASGVLSNIGLTVNQRTGIFAVADVNTSIVAASSTPGMFTAGTVTVNGEDIELEEGDTLTTVAAKFNAADTGITAHILKVADGQYRLSFTAEGSGDDFDLTDSGTTTDPDGVFTNIGLTAPNAASGLTLGTDAHFKINGISIVRSTNAIDDVIDGVTFNLSSTTPDSVTSYTASVQADTVTIQNAIVNFVKAYNAIKVFAAQQTQLNADGTYADTALLANNQSFRTIMSDINTQVVAQIEGLASTGVASLADVGITFVTQPASDTAPEVANILNVNDGKLSSMLATKLIAVRNFFGFNLTSNNPNLAVFSHTNALEATNFTLNVNPGAGTYTATYDIGNGPVTVNMTAKPLSGNVAGYMLTGPEGSALAGLKLIYASTDATTINVTATQGIADKLYNTGVAALESKTGLLAIAQQDLKDSNTRLNEDITRVNADVAQYREMLLKKFAALEQAISKINTLLQSLNANANAQLAASGN